MSDCALNIHGKRYCAEEEGAGLLLEYLAKRGIKGYKHKPYGEVLETVKEDLGVRNEKEVFASDKLMNVVGSSGARQLVSKYFKPSGPSNSTDSITNFNIMDCLKQWEVRSTEFGSNFKDMKYQMMDFKTTGKELYDLDIGQLVKDGYDCFGVILNTDFSTGRGKHWVCVFGDMRQEPWTLEYFNSSGNPPTPQVIDWFEKMRIETHMKHNKNLNIIYANNIRLQYSKTECGMWCLVYILNRIRGRPFNRFEIEGISDDEMYRCRKFIFSDS